VALSESSLRGVRVISESIHSQPTGDSSGIVHYLYAGDRSRSERVHPTSTGFVIERRDLRQRIRVFSAERKYQVIPLFDLASEEEKAGFRHSGRHWRRRYESKTAHATRQLKITLAYQDTADEQLMFGCNARRWIVRRRDEHDRKYGENWTEAITEAWYVEFQEVAAQFPGFSGDLVHHAFCYSKSGDEHAVIEHAGKRPSGLCVWSETKSLGHTALPNGETWERADNSSYRILSIAEESFPTSLFEPPTGFREMPVYPTWFTMARLDFARLFRRYRRTSA
jgi:hypothetical protein